jgi:hypothetical protein
VTAEQLIFVGLLASVITFVLRLVVQYFGYTPSRAVVNIGLYVIATVLAIQWADIVLPTFPPYTDPVVFVTALLAYVAEWLEVGAPVVGLATLIYNVLYDKVVVPLRAWVVKKLPAKS